FDGQHIVLERDVEVLGLQAWHGHVDQVAILGLAQVQRRHKALAAARARRDKAFLEQLIHRLTKREHVPEGVPSSKIRHVLTSVMFIMTFSGFRQSWEVWRASPSTPPPTGLWWS